MKRTFADLKTKLCPIRIRLTGFTKNWITSMLPMFACGSRCIAHNKSSVISFIFIELVEDFVYKE
jgi:hypothetical protein